MIRPEFVGHGLSKFGVESYLVNPVVKIRNSEGQIVANGIPLSEVDEAGYQIISETSRRVGAFPLDQGSSNVVILMVLELGAYTCLVQSGTDSRGEVLVEVYDVPPLVVDSGK